MATKTTPTSAPAHRMDVRYVPAIDAVPDSILLQTATIAGSVTGDAVAVRCPYIDDGAAQFTAEGDTIPESTPDLAEVVVMTGKVTQLVRVSQEQWEQDGTDFQLSESVARAVTKAANIAYLAQAKPTAPATTPAAGLLNVPGIVPGGAITGNLDAIVDAMASIEGNGGTPTHIIADPAGWARVRKLKTATGSAQSLLGAGTNDSERRLLDVPVLVTPAMPTGTLLIVDKSAVIAAVGEVSVAVSEHVYFAADSLALRCTWRFGQNLVRPNRCAKLTIAA